MFKRFTAVCLLAGILLITAACGFGGAKAPANPKPAEINISYVKLPLNVPSIVEKRLDLFGKEYGTMGIKTTYPEITQGPKMTEAMAAGSLDFANALGGTSAILAAANGVDVKIIGIYSRAPKSFTLMVKDPTINSPADLRGKKIAGPKGTILHQLLLAYLKQGGVKPDEVSFLNMDIPPAQAALLSGSVDAALVAGPAVTKTVAAGGRILATGEGLLDATIVIAVRGEFLRQYPDLVERYMKVHRQSLDYLKDHPDEVFQFTAEETGLTKEEVKQLYAMYDFSPAVTAVDIKDLEDTQEFLKANEMMTKTVDIKSMIKDMAK